jgi:zinc finger SWIM domain-containing protein 3
MFTERDMRNYISELRHLNLREGDAIALMCYFRDQQSHCPNFFYSYDHDEAGHLKNVFWADGRSRAAYNYFGDVLTFDTTYLTNR